MKVNFGLGTSTYHSVVNESNFLSELLRIKSVHMIEFIDTAPIYAHGKAEFWLGTNKSFCSTRRIITKVGLEYSLKTRIGFKIPRGKTLYQQLFPQEIRRISDTKVRKSYQKSCRNLQGMKPYGLLVHAYDGGQDCRSQLAQLRKLKQENIDLKIGVSIDCPLEEMPSELDIVEIPADFEQMNLLKNFQGLLVINQVFRKNLLQSKIDEVEKLQIEQVVLLCGSTKYERIELFLSKWHYLS
jgi:aryl-alcohol dehydrogenase-like predicted oxidoreductase